MEEHHVSFFRRDLGGKSAFELLELQTRISGEALRPVVQMARVHGEQRSKVSQADPGAEEAREEGPVEAGWECEEGGGGAAAAVSKGVKLQSQVLFGVEAAFSFSSAE